MDSLFLLLILLGIAFVVWKLLFKKEKTDVEQHYRVVKKKLQFEDINAVKERNKNPKNEVAQSTISS